MFKYSDEVLSKATVKRTLDGVLMLDQPVHPYPSYLHPNMIEEITSSAILGVEVEVEGIINQVENNVFWQSKEDGSLRNNGREFITFPTPACYIPFVFKTLQEALQENNTPVYSKRTSTHVHVNVLDMTVEQLKVFVLLYLCVENLIFNFVGNGRENSIFCVPLRHAGYINMLRTLFHTKTNARNIRNISRDWHKYTALNLKCMREIGTVEFRHMSGTGDTEYFNKWISIITSLHSKALITPLQEAYEYIKELNTSSEYENFITTIFEENRTIFPYDLKEYMEDSITYIKDCFITPAKLEVTPSKVEHSEVYKIFKLKAKTNVKEYSSLSTGELKKFLKEIEQEYNIELDANIRVELSRKYSAILNILEGF